MFHKGVQWVAKLRVVVSHCESWGRGDFAALEFHESRALIQAEDEAEAAVIDERVADTYMMVNRR